MAIVVYKSVKINIVCVQLIKHEELSVRIQPNETFGKMVVVGSYYSYILTYVVTFVKVGPTCLANYCLNNCNIAQTMCKL